MSDFARLASFDGRGPRSTFWWAAIGATLVGLAPVSSEGLLSLLGLPNWHPMAVFEGPTAGWAIWQQALSAAYWVALIATIWLLLAALVRRCHDRNRSGAFLLVGLIPVVQLWPLVELGLLSGSPEENDYGWPDDATDDLLDMPMTEAVQVVPIRQVVPTPYVAPEQPEAIEDPFAHAPLTLDEAAPMQARPAAEPSRTPLIFAPLVKYAQFDGRATRSEYWLFILFQWAVLIVVVAGLAALLPPGRQSAPFLIMGAGAAVIGLLLPHLAVTARRLHDSGLSFAWWLATFIPVVGGVISLVLMCLGGTRGDNAYGPNPRDTVAA